MKGNYILILSSFTVSDLQKQTASDPVSEHNSDAIFSKYSTWALHSKAMLHIFSDRILRQL